MKYRAAVFDLDGTLIDSLLDLADSANAMLSYYGFPVHTAEEYRYFLGNGSKKLIQRCLPENSAKDEAFVEEAMARYKKIYKAHTMDHTKPYEGILELLERLRKMQIPMGICTNKHQSAADVLVEKLLPKDTFEMVLGDRDGLPRKPDPKKILMMAEKFQVEPKEIAYFGDSGVDMETAVNGGFLPIGVLWGFREKAELLSHGAEVILKEPMELFEKVDFVKVGK